MAQLISLVVSLAFLAVATLAPAYAVSVLYWFAIVQLVVTLLSIGIAIGEIG